MARDAHMTDVHPDVGPELRLLAKKLLALVDPALQAAATLAPPADGAPGKCQQVWCPLCAVVAAASGEQHPLTTILSEHGSALLALIRALVSPDEPGATPDRPSPGAETRSPSTTSTYEHISVTIYE